MRASTVLGVVSAACLVFGCGEAREVLDEGPRWTLTGPMSERRTRHSATVLPTGLVLVVGGMPHAYPREPPGFQWESLASAEIYDPSLGIFTPTGSMLAPRSNHAAFLMSTGPHAGKVLVVGGCSTFQWSENNWYLHCNPLRTTELYDPTSGSWEPGPELLHPPGYWNIIQLADGKLLAAGTLAYAGAVPGAESQLFDPTTSTWEVVGSMNSRRVNQSMVLLETGEVLAVGGMENWAWINISNAAELYDPAERLWRTTTKPPELRFREVLIRLPDGRVLRAGACGDSDWFCRSAPPSAQAWIYDRSTETWRETAPMHYPHVHASGLLLDSGQVLVAGGNWANSTSAAWPLGYYPSPTPEIFDPRTETWWTTDLMPHYVMGGGKMVKLPSGAALFTGGYVNGYGNFDWVAISSVQVYQ